eukprot:6177402-Pleurochrysis_carterae.AAC.1
MRVSVARFKAQANAESCAKWTGAHADCCARAGISSHNFARGRCSHLFEEEGGVPPLDAASAGGDGADAAADKR